MLRRLRRELAAAVAATRYPTDPAAVADPRAARVAAVGLGLLLLLGAALTYLILTATAGPPAPRAAATPGSAAPQAGA